MPTRSILVRLSALLAASSSIVLAEGGPDPAKAPPPPGLLAPEAVTAVAARVALLEGPAFDADGNLFFSDIYANRIYRMTPDGKLSVFRADSGRTNGNTFDARGRLISCEGAEQGPGGRRRVVRTDLETGQVEVLTERYRGQAVQQPQRRRAPTPKGRIWFTDPFYGDDRSALEMDAEAVYRIDPDGTVTRVLSQPEIERPNGLALTPDGKTLYVVDSHARPGGNRKVWAFDVAEDGTPADRRPGLRLRQGAGRRRPPARRAGQPLGGRRDPCSPAHSGETADVPPGVYVITPDGRAARAGSRSPKTSARTWPSAGPDRKTLHVTAGKSIYKVPLTVSGYALYPAR